VRVRVSGVPIRPSLGPSSSAWGKAIKIPPTRLCRFGCSWNAVDHDLVFARADGSPIHPDRFARSFLEQAQRLGLPAIRLHDLHHTWATLALEAGVHPKVVSERLGHSTISITLDIYSHVSPAMQTDAADRVAALILGGPGRPATSTTGAPPPPTRGSRPRL
jgi:integrase